MFSYCYAPGGGKPDTTIPYWVLMLESKTILLDLSFSAFDVSVTDSGTDPHSQSVSPGFSRSASFPRPKPMITISP